MTDGSVTSRRVRLVVSFVQSLHDRLYKTHNK